MIKRIILPCIAVLSLVLLIAACGGDGDDDGDNGNVPDGPSAAFAAGCQPSDEDQFPNGPETIIDENRTYIATIQMESGDIVIELFSDTPVTTNNFVFLACKGFYDGVTFHRVIPGFMAQGGDPTGSGSGGPGYSIPDEDDGDHGMDAGVISMAKAGPNTTGSQFFITFAPQPHLEELGFTVFGQVTSGKDIVDGITPRDFNDPSAPPGDAMQTVTIEER